MVSGRGNAGYICSPQGQNSLSDKPALAVRTLGSLRSLIREAWGINLPLPENLVHRSIDIMQLLLSQAMALDDGANQNSSQMNVTIPGSLNFTLYGLSSFTEYSVYAVATYIESNCSKSSYDGEAIKIRTERKCMCINFCAFV